MNVHATPGLRCSLRPQAIPVACGICAASEICGGKAEHAVGYVPAVGMAPPVHDHLLEEFVAEGSHADELAVVRGEPVVGEVEAAHDTDDRGFLPRERRDGADLTLPLEVPEPLRRPPGEQHVAHEMTVELGVGFGGWVVGRRAGYRSKFRHLVLPAALAAQPTE